MEQEDIQIAEPSQSSISQSSIDKASSLALLSERFVASLMDGIIAGIPGLILFLIIFGFHGLYELLTNTGIVYAACYTIMYQAVFYIINFNSLMKGGQTIGKRILDIKIVTMKNELPSLASSYFIRYLIPALCGLIPVAGFIFGLIDVLFIFGKERRCIHDYLAGTRVVKA